MDRNSGFLFPIGENVDVGAYTRIFGEFGRMDVEVSDSGDIQELLPDSIRA